MKLQRYHDKRQFDQTSEPKGQVHAEDHVLSYVVQAHEASHFHYDFRLAWKGVLKSWSVPKGPSLKAGEKRLAVEVEDHPLEYGMFEGSIPKGQYGGGTVMLWDYGLWEPINDPAKGLVEGKLHFRLKGARLKGEWNLVRMRTPSSKPQWLLIKGHDEFAKAVEIEIAREELVSIETGRTFAQIAKIT